jgi:hypothetical protein
MSVMDEIRWDMRQLWERRMSEVILFSLSTKNQDSINYKNLFPHFLSPGASDTCWIWTLGIWVIRQVVYHCATVAGQIFFQHFLSPGASGTGWILTLCFGWLGECSTTVLLLLEKMFSSFFVSWCQRHWLDLNPTLWIDKASALLLLAKSFFTIFCLLVRATLAGFEPYTLDR